MGLFSGIGDLVKQFSGENAGATPSNEQFQQVATAAPPQSVAGGLAEIFRSSSTAPFPQQASQLFAKSDGPQQASVLNTLIAAAGPGLLAHLGGSSSLGSLFQGGQTTVTPEQAQAVPPEEVQSLAEHAAQHDPSVMDKLSQVYAAHPQLIQSLGAAAMAIAVQHIAKNHQG